MKALVYLGPDSTALEQRPVPQLQSTGDAIVKIEKTTTKRLITHQFGLDQIQSAYDTFSCAAQTGVLKVIITM